MRINWNVRIKNPYFWVGLLGVILTAMGIDPAMLTSWQAVADAAKGLVSNPYMLFSVCAAVLGVCLDPTTAGMGDSERAMQYSQPNK